VAAAAAQAVAVVVVEAVFALFPAYLSQQTLAIQLQWGREVPEQPQITLLLLLEAYQLSRLIIQAAAAAV
jgi:hypothetical protein